VRQLSTGRSLAVKRARLVHPDSRRRFLAELQLWSDLPPHPHLVPCRFFRTVEEGVVIFMARAAGGSLAACITRGQPRQTAADVLETSLADPETPAQPGPMPPAVVEVLRRCFRHAPAERWPDLASVADRLGELSRSLTGQEYLRPMPAPASRAAAPLLAPQR